MKPLDDAALFLIQTLFDLYLYVVWLRILLPHVKADYYHPLSQAVIRMTDGIIKPFSRVVPNIQSVNIPAVLLLFLVGALKIWLLLAIQSRIFAPHPVAWLLITCADLMNILLDFYFFAIIFRVIISWLQAGYHPISEMIIRLTNPLIAPLAKRIPIIAGLDFSPLAAIVVLKLTTLILVAPLSHFGFGWL